jgi:hypothetical protein
MASRSTASLHAVFGPRFCGTASAELEAVAYTVDRASRYTWQIIVSGYRR